MKQESQEIPTTFIEDRGLAEAMAYGEKPHIEVALGSMKTGKFQETAGHLVVAEAASNTAGKEFVDAEQARIDSLRTTLNGDIRRTEHSKTEIELTPNLHEKADKTIEAMSAKFNIDSKDLTVLMIETKAGKKPVVVYTAGNGIDLGDPKEQYDNKRSWKSIFDKKNAVNFMVEVDGQQVDTRKGMTREVYDTMYNEAKANGQVLPDSQELAEQNDQPWTYTLLTGEEADRDFAPVADVRDGEVAQYVSRRDYDSHVVRFRPAVVIE